MESNYVTSIELVLTQNEADMLHYMIIWFYNDAKNHPAPMTQEMAEFYALLSTFLGGPYRHTTP